MNACLLGYDAVYVHAAATPEVCQLYLNIGFVYQHLCGKTELKAINEAPIAHPIVAMVYDCRSTDVNVNYYSRLTFKYKSLRARASQAGQGHLLDGEVSSDLIKDKDAKFYQDHIRLVNTVRYN
jgi:hypothetical protein